jgi:hypothetical protein
MGEHNARYDLYGGCGPGFAKLPPPDLQPVIDFHQQIYSGQSVDGNVCFQVAANDAASLLLALRWFAQDDEHTVWFALR